jgi:hypothetical protein
MPDTPDNQGFQPVASQPVAPPPQPMGAAPYQPVAVAPPPKQGSSALKIVLIVVGIFVCLGVLAAGVVGYGIYKVAHAVKTAANGQISINSPGGSFSASTTQSVSSSDLGIAVYPGATQGKGGLHMTIAGKSMVSQTYLTSDSKDQVIAFYKDKAGPNAQVMSTDAGGVISVTNGNDALSITVLQNANSNDGKTQITIIHTTGVASN